jgi:hypothetical protein
MDLRMLEAATARFYEWELRGRGWSSYSHPVPLEPVFVPFPGHRSVAASVIDDTRKETILSSLVARLLRRPGDAIALPLEIREPDPDEARLPPEPPKEFEVLIPPGEKVDQHSSSALIRALSGAAGPISYELIGTGGRVSLRFACHDSDASTVSAHLRAHVPAAVVREPEFGLLDLWAADDSDSYGVIDFGLAHEFMLPLRELRANPDPLTAFVGALSACPKDGFGLVQVLFEPTQAPWYQSALHAVTAPDGEPFFIDAPELTSLAREKFSAPLYAASVRVLASGDEDAVSATVLRLASALAQYGDPDRNALVPLAVEDNDRLVRDILTRSTHRSGMLLSLDELASIARLPSEHLKSPALLREVVVEPSLPRAALGDQGAVIGQGKHQGHVREVRLADEARLQHLHVIGATGTGKSTLLENLVIQDINAGHGVGVLDPHGDLVDEILARIPDERIADVVYFDPSDDEGVIGWNILGAHSELEKDLLASDLVAVFRRLSTSWGDQMSAVLANAVLAFLESTQGGTLVELRRFLLDEAFRTSFLGTVRDDHVLSFWRDEYPMLIGKKPAAPILTRLDTFLRSRLVREVVTERERPLNFRELIDTGKIFLAKLSQGAIGEENAALLGSLLVSKFHQVSLSRQDVAAESRRPFFLYIDELQQVATPSMAGLFSGIRKYRLALTVAHQDLYQLHTAAPELERAVLTNAHVRLVFRVSDEDARKLERGVGEFTAADLANLGRGEAICRIGRSEDSFRLKTLPLEKVGADEAEARQLRARRASVARYGRPRRARPIAASLPTEPEQVSAPPPERSPVSDPRPAEPRRPEVASTPGRGGATHKYLQAFIRESGQAHGFRAEIEHALPDGKRVDVYLAREDVTVACEIAGTSTIDNELANLQKNLATDCTHVCAVSLDGGFLRRLEKAAATEIADEYRDRLHFFAPQELVAFLAVKMITPETKRVAGYNVQVRHSSGASDVDRKRTIADVMLRSVRRMREKKP